MFLPTHSAYFASYFTITGLHGMHVLGGVLVFIYMWLPVSKQLYQRNPEHLANRVEVSGLFWHFVDLVWIFVFPLFIFSNDEQPARHFTRGTEHRGIRPRTFRRM